MMIKDLSNVYNFSHVIFRYFNVAGADPKLRTGQISKNSTHLIKVASETLLGKRKKLEIFGNDYETKDGTCIRDYIHVSDLVDAHLEALYYLNDNGSSVTLNCGYGKGYSVLDVVSAINKIGNKNITIKYSNRRKGDPVSVVANNSLIKNTINWNPKYNSLEMILKDALRWENKITQGL